MHNPFESLNARLDKLEALTRETQQMLRGASKPAAEIGGMDLARELTRLSTARIYTLVSEGKIPVSKRGNRLTFNRFDLLDWINQGKRGPQTTDC